ncbi:MAG TPA: 2-isopropylmalate synthase [Planctomycetota bacterium]|jgi:2-isopropylmalate synthase|nr:2-isopropylmalate synthase [Planctomycetota bacterium]
MRRIKIFDTTLRDGEQSPGASMNVGQKLVVARQLDRLGVDIIEAGFPITSAGDFEGVQRIAEEVRRPVICALARTRPEDIEAAAKAIAGAQRRRIHVFIATSDIHMDKKLRMSPDQVVETATRGVKLALQHTDDVEFSPEDCSRTDLEFMCRVVEAAIDAGATTINIPDTVGYTVPEEIARRIFYLKEKVPSVAKVTLSIHCHNDLGLAVANSLAAMEAGCDQIECTINGIGERAGNASLEEIVMAMWCRKDCYKAETGIDTREIFKTSRLVSELTGIGVQRNKAIVGENAFAHEAGIHQHGVMAHRSTYEIIHAEDVGWEGEQIVIGKHSGIHAIEKVLAKHRYDLSKDQLREVTNQVKELADAKKTIEEDDIVALALKVLDQLAPNEQLVELKEVSVMTGDGFTPSATIKLTVSGREVIGQGTGVGPVDAAAHALQSLIHQEFGPHLELKEYGLKAITGGTDALADAQIRFADQEGHSFRGEAINKDVIMASVLAMIEGANRAVNFQKRTRNTAKPPSAPLPAGNVV